MSERIRTITGPRTAHLAAIALLASLGAVGTVAAQGSGSQWLAWQGCWVEVAVPGEAPITCVVPTVEGVRVHSVSEGEIRSTRTLVADGADHRSDVEGCTGVERATFSADGHRVFLESERTCEGDVERTTRGILAMVEPAEWIEVEALTIAGHEVAWVKRFRPAPLPRVEEVGLGWLQEQLVERELAVETARMAASSPVDVDAIIEASRHTDAEAVRAWLTEQGDRIDLDAERLVRMADAGVSPAVIDVVVAVSYPERFQVARESDRRVPNAYGTIGPFGVRGPYGWPYYYDPFYYGRYSAYGRYGGIWGYPSWGYPYGGPAVVVVRPTDDDRGSSRVVNGRGYTRGTSGSASSGSLSSPGYSQPSGGSGSSGSSASSGSSSGSKGTAKPRGGG